MSDCFGSLGFNTIADSVYLYVPKSVSYPTKGTPKLIVLAAWMGALPKYIGKYTAGYQGKFPDAAILLIQSSIGDVFSSDAKQAVRLTVAAKTILNYHQDKSLERSILLHAKSNGGAIAAVRIASIINSTGHGKIFDKVIFDCLPGSPDVESFVTAVCVGLPRNPIVQFLASWGLRTVGYVGMFVAVTMLGCEDLVTRLRRQLNDGKLFDKSAPRLYLYSKADKLIDYVGVHEHALDASDKGFAEVKEVVFEKASHCALLMENVDRYWGSIKDLLKE